MPISTVLFNYKQDNNLIKEEQNYDIRKLIQIFENKFSQLNIDQQAIFKKVVMVVENQIFTIIFVNSLGKTGKTFLYK
jgi:predicted chitinase